MQNKGLVKLFALLFGLVSIYQLSFSFKANQIEENAKQGKSIIIKSYLSSFPNVSPIVTNLSVGEELIKTETTRHSYSFADFFGKNDSSRDSLKIVYQNNRVSFFNTNSCEDVRNPLNVCEYGNLEETFIFTEQDYENAEDCNGNCE